MMLTEGINRTRDLFDTNTDQGQFGTGTTKELVTDTALVSPLSDTLESTTSSTASQFLVKTTTISSTEGNDSSWGEFALIKSSNSKLISRITFRTLAKTNLLNARSKVRFFFK